MQDKGWNDSPGKKLLVFPQNRIMAKTVCSTHVGTKGTTAILKSCFHFTSNPNLTIMLSPGQKSGCCDADRVGRHKFQKENLFDEISNRGFNLSFSPEIRGNP